MGTYAIGDIQGCYQPFLQLLARIRFDPDRDRLWLVGDLLNRGPASLEVLRWIVSHADNVQAVLGNHDVYALARAYEVVSRQADDTLDALMKAPDRDHLIAWLVRQPVLLETDGHVLVHAGLLPEWDLAAAKSEAERVHAFLRSDPKAFLQAYFHKRRYAWSPTLEPIDRAVAALAVLSRIRFVDPDGRMVQGSGAPESPPVANAVPWFTLRKAECTILFGHWASLGLWIDRDVIGLDSGCVWHGSLTALRIEDRAVFAVPNRKEHDR